MRNLFPDLTDGRENLARMLISCPDRPGIVAAVSRFLHAHEEGAAPRVGRVLVGADDVRPVLKEVCGHVQRRQRHV